MYGTIEHVRGFSAVKSRIATQSDLDGDGDGDEVNTHFLSG